jgi:hypothetical protein
MPSNKGGVSSYKLPTIYQFSDDRNLERHDLCLEGGSLCIF